MNRYRLKGLDCATCAARIQEGVRKVPGVRAVSVDFATLSMSIDASDMDAVVREIARLEPEVRVDPEGMGGPPLAEVERPQAPPLAAEERRRLAIDLGLMGVAVAGLAAGLLLRQRLDGFAAWPAWALFAVAWLAAGWNVLAAAARTVVHGRVLDESFLMVVATLGAFAVGAFAEGVAVMLFYKIGEMAQGLAVGRSRRSIRALLELRPDIARVRNGAGWRVVSPEEVAVGTEVLVKPGERIPVDGEVTEGAALVNTAALTGEPVARRAAVGREVLAGTSPIDGTLVIRSVRLAGQSSAARIIELVEAAAHAKAPTEKLVSRLARVYTPVVVGLAAVVAFLPPLVVPGQALATWVYRALVLLVISCPCALVVSVPLGYVGGLGGASRRGILVKGAAALDALAEARSIVFDKTGTLTRGVFTVKRVKPADGFSAEELLGFAAAAESHSNHPIAASIREAWRERGGGEAGQSLAAGHREIGGRGVAATVSGHAVLAGNDALMHDEKVPHEGCGAPGTVVHVAVDGRYAGHLVIGDELKDDAADAVDGLRALGFRRLTMLTGDRGDVARELGRELGLDEVHGDLLPEGKLRHLEAIMAGGDGGRPRGWRAAQRGRRRSPRRQGATIFVGDGINDAPVLARADVGIAMGRDGADAAVESADVVLMSDHPSRIVEAVRRARLTRAIVVQNIVFALSVKAAFLVLGAAGEATMWEAVIADMGVALLAILNATRALR